MGPDPDFMCLSVSMLEQKGGTESPGHERVLFPVKMHLLSRRAYVLIKRQELRTRHAQSLQDTVPLIHFKQSETNDEAMFPGSGTD